MTDDYFSSLLIIAMEKDIVNKITNERIIQRFAALSPVKWNEMKWKCSDLKCIQKPWVGLV